MKGGKRLGRLNKELQDIQTFKEFKVETDPNDFLIWYISFKGAEGTLFAGEDFKLQFKFPPNYVRNNNNIL
mgnify:CR=1 FL=1